MYSTKKITSRQAEVLDFLEVFHGTHGSAPTYREIAKRFGFKSPRAASDHIAALEKKGYVTRRAGQSRGIELLFPKKESADKMASVPLMGEIQAGMPIWSSESKGKSLKLDFNTLGLSHNHRLYVLKVYGDSMINRSIEDGDLIVVDADQSPKLGNIIVALIDNENTLKTLTKNKSGFFLKAENPAYPDLVPYREMMSQGVVQAVIRRL